MNSKKPYKFVLQTSNYNFFDEEFNNTKSETSSNEINGYKRYIIYHGINYLIDKHYELLLSSNLHQQITPFQPLIVHHRDDDYIIKIYPQNDQCYHQKQVYPAIEIFTNNNILDHKSFLKNGLKHSPTNDIPAYVDYFENGKIQRAFICCYGIVYRDDSDDLPAGTVYNEDGSIKHQRGNRHDFKREIFTSTTKGRCFICNDEFKDEEFIAKTICNHRIHGICLHKHFEKTNTNDCPVCKRNLLKVQYRQKFPPEVVITPTSISSEPLPTSTSHFNFKSFKNMFS